VYQLEQGLGTVLVARAAEQVRELQPHDRSALGRAGVRVGRHVIFSAKLLQPGRCANALCFARPRIGWRLDQPKSDAVSFVPSSEVSDASYVAMGFPVIGGRAIRADVRGRRSRSRGRGRGRGRNRAAVGLLPRRSRAHPAGVGTVTPAGSRLKSCCGSDPGYGAAIREHPPPADYCPSPRTCRSAD